MTRRVEVGVFMPVGSNGFMMSNRTPRYDPTFALHRDIAVLAERCGLDYVFWMGKWKGYDGTSGYWRSTLEPLTLASAVASATSRIKLFATISPLLFHPAVAAKMISTIDEVSGGRFGINIVTGNTLDEYEQMDMVPPGYNETRYAYADEWLEVMKLLWREDRVTYAGERFNLRDCVSDPKPVRRPYPLIISAGTSPEGLAFAGKHSDYAFGATSPDLQATVRSRAAAHGRDIKVLTNVFLLQRPTDEQATEDLAAIRDSLDVDAIAHLIAAGDRDNRASYERRKEHLLHSGMVGFGAGLPIAGSPETIADRLAALIADQGLDGVQLTFVNWLDDLLAFHRDVQPLLIRRLAEHDIAVGEQVAAPAGI
jgi:pyrimidine oxygenase